MLNPTGDISSALYSKDPPVKRGERNGWPIPDPEPNRRGARVMSKGGRSGRPEPADPLVLSPISLALGKAE